MNIQDANATRIYIAGCGGMLGDAFFHKMNMTHTLKCTDIDVNEAWLSFCDFREFDSYRKDVLDFKPNFLFHLGAHTDLEFCEKNPDEAYITNTLSVEHAVWIANELNIPLLYISTAGIFDGSRPSFDDWSKPNPMGVYAHSKYLGEQFVIQHAKKYYICRAGWMMGGGKKDKKFVKKILEQIRVRQKEIYVVNDKTGTPTYTYDFALNTMLLINSPYQGVYNMVCEGKTSRLEISKFILEYLKLEHDIKIIEVDSSYFQEQYFAPRPSSEILINKKLHLRKLASMRNWKEALAEYLQREKCNFSDTD